jgi:hypothetical protein
LAYALALKMALPRDGVYFKSAGPEIQQIRLGLNETPAAEHLTHRIGYVLQSCPAHRFGDYATEHGQVPKSPNRELGG